MYACVCMSSRFRQAVDEIRKVSFSLHPPQTPVIICKSTGYLVEGHFLPLHTPYTLVEVLWRGANIPPQAEKLIINKLHQFVEDGGKIMIFVNTE